LTLTLFTLI